MPKGIKQWFKRILLGTFVLVLVGWVVGSWLLQYWTASPPPLPGAVTILAPSPAPRSGRVRGGEAWSGPRSGLERVRVGMIKNGLNIWNVGIAPQLVAQGVVIVAAIAFDQYLRRER